MLAPIPWPAPVTTADLPFVDKELCVTSMAGYVVRLYVLVPRAISDADIVAVESVLLGNERCLELGLESSWLTSSRD
jgi:hypothetical protein